MAIAGKVAITPKGEWNANTAYTKLDLVFYENASYVAIQPSTGVEPTNTSYWMLMVQSAGGADLEAIINGTAQVGNAKTLDGHEAEYFAIASPFRKYVFISDSYGNRTNADGKNWIALACEKCGIDASNYYDIHTGSAGFTRDGNLKFLTMLQNASIQNKEEITDIFIGAGANDTLQTYELNVERIEEFMEYVKQNFPNASVTLAHIGITFRTADMWSRFNTSLKAYRNAHLFGARYASNTEYILCSISLFESDMCHPNETGVEQIANHMAEVLQTGKCNVHRYNEPTLSKNNTNTFFDSGRFTEDSYAEKIVQIANNENVILSGKGGGTLTSISFDNVVTVPESIFLSNLFSLSDSFVIGGNFNLKSILGSIEIRETSGATHAYPCLYYFPSFTSGKQTIGIIAELPSSIQNVNRIIMYIGTVQLFNDF